MAKTAGGMGRDGAVPTWALAALALVLAAALMAWLAMTAEPSNSGIDVQEEEQADSATLAAEQVPGVALENFAGNEDDFIGTEVRFVSAPVDSRMGTRAFWVKLPNQGLYLVRMPVGRTVQPGQNMEVVGTVVAMGDSVVASWLEDGSITPNDEIAARYATSFIDAWYVRPARAGARTNGGASTAGDTAAAAASGDTTGAAATGGTGEMVDGAGSAQ